MTFQIGLQFKELLLLIKRTKKQQDFFFHQELEELVTSHYCAVQFSNIIHPEKLLPTQCLQLPVVERSEPNFLPRLDPTYLWWCGLFLDELNNQLFSWNKKGSEFPLWAKVLFKVKVRDGYAPPWTDDRKSKVRFQFEFVSLHFLFFCCCLFREEKEVYCFFVIIELDGGFFE